MENFTQEDEIIFIADPRILAMSVVENGEAIVDLKDQNEIVYGPSPEIPNNTDYTKLRKTVYEKLKQAQSLLPSGLRFCLYEGYRSLELQKLLFDTRFEKVKNKHPNLSNDEIFIETTRLVSPVINLDGSKNIPPHSTAGAFDIYLIDDNGEYIEMGIHPKDWIDDSGIISATASAAISQEAKENRKIMGNALSSVGFVNYLAEYWHWSYGDRYWAYYKREPYAIYSSC